MLSVSEIVAKTETMFDLFNDHFYAGELARPAITVSPDGGRGAVFRREYDERDAAAHSRLD